MTFNHVEPPVLPVMFKIRLLFILIAITILNSPHSLAKDNVAKDLGSSRELIENKKNKELFDYQMGNTDVNPSDIKLGKLINSDPQYNKLLELLEVGKLSQDETELLSVGLKQIPYQQGVYIGWVFIRSGFYPSLDEHGLAIKDRLNMSFHPPRLLLALLKNDTDSSSKFVLINKSILKPTLRDREDVSSFDFAPYNLGSLGRAFGMRTEVNGCGGGGSLCSNEYLKLFVVQNNDLTLVFNEATAYFGNIAGNWHKDGSRDHQIIEVNGIIKIINSPNSSIPELLLRAKINGKMKQRTFKATTEASSSVVYRSSDKQIIDLVDDF